MGVVECDDVVGGEHLGQYAGQLVPDSALVIVAELLVSLNTVSRVTNKHCEEGCVLGKIDLDWCILHASAESFMNAGTKDDEVNVVMDRTKAWTYAKMAWMSACCFQSPLLPGSMAGVCLQLFFCRIFKF